MSGHALPPEVQATMEASIRQFLDASGVDLEDSLLAQTPQRIARSFYTELLAGYRTSEEELFEVMEESSYDGMILARDLEFFSICAHHLLPFNGSVSIAYLPAGKILPIAWIGRVVDCFSRRLQVPQRLAQQIAAALDQRLAPRGVLVAVRAENLCNAMRGISQRGAVDYAFAGVGALAKGEEEYQGLISKIFECG